MLYANYISLEKKRKKRKTMSVGHPKFCMQVSLYASKQSGESHSSAHKSYVSWKKRNYSEDSSKNHSV